MTRETVETNYFGNKAMFRAFYPLINRHGRIVVLSSTNSQYAASLIRSDQLKHRSGFSEIFKNSTSFEFLGSF